MQSPDALVRAEPSELAATILLLGWVFPQRPPADGVGLQVVLGDLLAGMGIVRGATPKQRFDEVWQQDFTWAYEPLVEDALHLQSRSLCLCTADGDSAASLRRVSVLVFLLRRGRQAVQSGDVLSWVR
jgi:hypothetical protein